MMEKILDSSGFFCLISLTFCVMKLFERIILSRRAFVLESNSILFSLQAGFRPDRSTLDQILYLSHSISNGFSKPKPSSRTILTTIDLLKDFGSIWQPAHFHKLISAGLSCYFVQWTQSFHSLIGALCVVFQNWESRSFCVRRGVAQRSVLGPARLFLFLNGLPMSLSALLLSVVFFMLTNWPFGSLLP